MLSRVIAGHTEESPTTADSFQFKINGSSALLIHADSTEGDPNWIKDFKTTEPGNLIFGNSFVAKLNNIILLEAQYENPEEAESKVCLTTDGYRDTYNAHQIIFGYPSSQETGS
ncbi:hypothetical protein DID80_04705 [Candidatus Marinamargulisbacteria bacterium SCGC AAA071-K20]|nr:hypothetical protein DID80_04705 [Candidatus Marinamargulisbacteria bacterium SCGC AAA071-K20]